MRCKKFWGVTAFALLTMSTTPAFSATPKYVFFFLGDGMSSSQIQATEAYLTTKNGDSATEAQDLLQSSNRLNFTQFPVLGMQTTFDAHALMTDSASSATAFACGLKTQSGVIGMDDAKTTSYKSIAQLAHEQGMRVGVISSVSLDHATPAAYYASVANRNYMNNIATQLANSGYEFFGGGGLASPTGPKSGNTSDTSNNVWDVLEENGYTVLNDRASIIAQMNAPEDQVVCINNYLQNSAAMPYAIDRDAATNLSLAEMTQVAIKTLENDDDTAGFSRRKGTSHRWASWKHHGKGRYTQENGFFLMVEGGKIDWACHANDALAAIGDTLDFDDAVGMAVQFYNQHPSETLIVVTGDHETGGLTIGHATTGYSAHYDELLGQKMSFQAFGAVLRAYKENHTESYVDTVNNFESSELLPIVEANFGLDYSDLNAFQKEKLEAAFDKSMDNTINNDNSDAENAFLYGGYEPIIVTITHILNENASIGWTSYSHTGVPVPVFALGAGAKTFSGFYDNTDIAKKLASVMGIHAILPVVRD